MKKIIAFVVVIFILLCSSVSCDNTFDENSVTKKEGDIVFDILYGSLCNTAYWEVHHSFSSNSKPKITNLDVGYEKMKKTDEYQYYVDLIVYVKFNSDKEWKYRNASCIFESSNQGNDWTYREFDWKN